MSIQKYDEAKKIIESNAEHFLERIRSISEIGPAKKIRRNTPGFAILKPGNKEYYEYEYYAVNLEWYIREFLINETFQQLFELYGIQAQWPNTKGVVYARFRNESIENIIPFEFIIVKKGNKIGYRYTPVDEDECYKLRKKYNLSKTCVIDWTTEDTCGENKQEGNSLRTITAKTFLTYFFGESIYELFIKIACSSVEEANREIGFQTIPRFSLRYLSNIKDELEKSLYEIDYQKLRYKALDSSEKEYYENINFSVSDYTILDNYYKGEKLYRAITGTKGFAKCFLTAEYLYYIFKDGNYFDYTSVVSGYLKSVEQLIYEILNLNLSFVRESDNYWIKKGNKIIKWKTEKRNQMLRKNPVTNKTQIKFLPQNKRYFDITMVPMIWFLYDNDRYRVSIDGKKAIHELLLRYSQECRNEHFHKDNIEIFDEVKAIRNNTYLILYILLGGCKLLDRQDSKEALGITDKKYERLYKSLIEIPKSVRKFYIKFEGQEEKLAYRLINQDKPQYDLYGFLVLSDIKFVSKKNYTDIENEGGMVPDIIIDRNNIPEKIWFVKYGGERVLISS